MGECGMTASVDALRELMAGQLGIWYLQQFAPENPVYNVGEYLEIRGGLSEELFVQAIRRAVHECDTLALGFCEVDGVPRQYLGDPDSVPVAFIDLSAEEDP